MFESLREAIPVLLDFTQYLFNSLGTLLIFFGISGIMKLSSDPRNGSLMAESGEFVFGGILLSNGYWIPLIVSTFTSDFTSTSNILSYMGSSHDASSAEEMMRTVVSFAELLGILGIFKGIMLLRKSSRPSGQHNGEDSAVSGLSFIVFGSAAANMPWTLKVAAVFFGFSLPAFLN